MSERAFPVENPRATEQRGMTLRDYFAAQCITGFLPGKAVEDSYIDHFAKRAYQVADAMLKARSA